MINRTKGISFAAALMVFAAALTAAPAGAQEPGAGETMAELQEWLEDARERLKLGDEQVEQLLPVLGESFDSTRVVLEKHGINLLDGAEGDSNRRPNLRRLRSLSRDLNEVREAMFEKIEELGFLNDEQFAEFKKLQEEHRAALRERIRARLGRG